MADFAERRGSERCRLKHCDPFYLLACINAAAPIMDMCGVVSECFGASSETRFCRGSVAALAVDVDVRGDKSRRCGQNLILPNTQSINGL